MRKVGRKQLEIILTVYLVIVSVMDVMKKRISVGLLFFGVLVLSENAMDAAERLAELFTQAADTLN